MKKLLTIVLCVAVMFTFSFSGAFASSSDVNDKLAEEYLDDALDAVDGSADSSVVGGYKPDGIWIGDPDTSADNKVAYDEETANKLNVTYDILVANKADLLEAAKEWAADNSGSYIGQTANGIVTLLNWTAKSANEKKTSYEDLYQTLASAQFAADKQEALDILDGISFSDVSTKEMKKDCAHTVACETYKEHVQKLVEDARKAIDELKNTSDTAVYDEYDDEMVDDCLFANEAVIDSIIGRVSLLGEGNTKTKDKWTDESRASEGKSTWIVVQKAYNNAGKWEGLSSYELNEDWAEIETPQRDCIYYKTTKTNNYYDATNNNTIGSYLTDNKDADDASSDAKIESLKAQVAAAKAAYLKKNNSTSQKEYADNMQEALNYLIEQEEITADNIAAEAPLASIFPTDKEISTNGSDKYGVDAKAAVKYAKELKDEAATLAAETDENGTLIRDKKDVDDLLEAGLIAIYKLGKGDASAVYEGTADKTETSIATAKSDCKSDIEALYVSLDDTKLAYYKQNSISLLNKYYQVYAEDYENAYGMLKSYIGYYTPEKTEFKAALDKAVASIEAATKYQQVDKALETFKKDYNYTDIYATIGGEDTKMDVMSKNGDTVDELFNDAIEYAELLNSKIKKSDNQYVAGMYNGKSVEDKEERDSKGLYCLKLYTLITDLVGEKDARTTADINKLNDEAMQLVKTLPIKKTVDDAKEALDDAMKALPSTIKLADADKIDAACEALDAYYNLTSDPVYKVAELQSKIEALAYAENNALDEKYDKIDKTDKEALDALQDEIDTFVEKYGKYMFTTFGFNETAVTDLGERQVSDDSEWSEIPLETLGNAAIRSTFTVDDEISDDLDKIRQDDLDDVKAAINKIPAKANITEESKPVIQAARKAYDAYVQKWTSYENEIFTWTAAYDANGGYAADDLASYYQTLTAAEAAAGLNTTSDADLVKELKIVAKSTAKKGSIKVTWKVVEGDASVADGYQVWKSTKHSKGYKKAFTTAKKSYKNTKDLKKGVRYYYKVRAYKVVDGKNVYSDWSNKARRVAK